MEALAGLDRGLGALGGGLALFFIVTLASGIVGLALLYLGSAVVVLERFARVARRPVWVVVCAAATCLLASAAWLAQTTPELELESWAVRRAQLGPVLLRAAPATALCTAAAWIALRRIPAERLADLALVGIAVLIGLVAGGSGAARSSLAPAAVLALFALGLGVLRRRRGAEAAGSAELRARWMCLGVLVGLPIAVLPLPPDLVEGAGELGRQGLAAAAGLVLLGLLPLAAAGFIDMRGSAEWFIAVRYLVAKRRQVFISAITAICVVGIAAGVWLIIVVLSVMNGFEQTWREEILGNRAHFTIHSRPGPFEDYQQVLERVRSVPGVVAASPYVDADGMLRGRGGDIYSVRLRGIDPRVVGDVTSLRDDLLMGELEALLSSPGAGEGGGGGPAGESASDDPAMLVGNQLASALGVGVGDELLVISPFGGPPTPLGPAPRLQRFRVAGVYRSSFYQFDEVYTYTSLASAQRFRGSGDEIDGVEAVTTDYYRSQRVGEAVQAALGPPFYTRDWKEYFPAFFQALKTERVMMFLLLTMIMVVAAFVIVATLIMMIMEKSSDIAILKAMGAEDSLVERVFALEGTLIGLVGTALGVVAGIAVTHRLTWIQDRIEMVTGIDTLPQTVYQFSTLPSRVEPLQVALVVFIAMVLSLGATLLPSRQGARLDPAEGLRHE